MGPVNQAVDSAGRFSGGDPIVTTQFYTLVTADAVREAWATAHPRAL